MAGAHANVLLPADPGESMAETRTRMYPEQMDLVPDPVFTDIWTDPVLAGRSPDPDLVLTYDGLPPGVTAPVNGIVNYPDHIHPLWEADRGENTCTNCHDNDVKDDPVSAGLNLKGTIGGTGRLTSYEQLMVGDPVIDETTGLPVLRVMDDGEIEVVREPALVETGNSSQSSRTAHLVEKLFEQELRAGYALTTPPSVDHAGMLSPGELRMVAEWIDLGGQYYNDAHDDADGDGYRALSEVRGGIRGLSESTFESSVHTVLMEQCAACHQPFGGLGIPGEPENPDFSPNRFVLTGNVEGDLNVSLSMVDDVCSPETSYLLLYPSAEGPDALPHPMVDDPAVADDPAMPQADDRPVLRAGEPGYEAIRAWIAAGDCQT